MTSAITAPQQDRNGYFSEDQILRAATAAHQAMRAQFPKQIYSGVHFTAASPTGDVASPAMRALLSALLTEAPLKGAHVDAAGITDQQIVAAAVFADAEGMVSLTYTDRAGQQRPTGVIEDFLQHLFSHLNPN